jgi:hypothetical protein
MRLAGACFSMGKSPQKYGNYKAHTVSEQAPTSMSMIG